MTISSVLAMLAAGDAHKVQPNVASDLMPFGVAPAQPAGEMPAGEEIVANLFSSVLSQLIPSANNQTPSNPVNEQSVSRANTTAPAQDVKPKSHLPFAVEDEVRPAPSQDSSEPQVVVAPQAVALLLARAVNTPAPPHEPQIAVVIEQNSSETSEPDSADTLAQKPTVLTPQDVTERLASPAPRLRSYPRTTPASVAPTEQQEAPASIQAPSIREDAQSLPARANPDQSSGEPETSPVVPETGRPDVIRSEPAMDAAPAAPVQVVPPANRPAIFAEPVPTAQPSQDHVQQDKVATPPSVLSTEPTPPKRKLQSNPRHIDSIEPTQLRTSAPELSRQPQSVGFPTSSPSTGSGPQPQLTLQPPDPKRTEQTQAAFVRQAVVSVPLPGQISREEESTDVLSLPEPPRQSPAVPVPQTLPAADNRPAEPEIDSQFRRRPAAPTWASAQLPQEPTVTTERAPTEQTPTNPNRQNSEPIPVPEATTRNAMPTPADTQIAFTGRLIERKTPESALPQAPMSESNRRLPVDRTPAPTPQEAVPENEPHHSMEAERPALHAEQPMTFSAVHREIAISVNPRPAPEAAPAAHPLRTEAVHEPATRPSSEPIREISMRIGDQAQESAHLRVVERGGEVLVSVRSGSEQLARTLSNDLSELTHRLEQTGFQAELWRPAAQGSSNGDLSRDHRDSASTPGQNQDQPAPPQRRGDWQDQPGQRRRELWEELDENFSFS